MEHLPIYTGKQINCVNELKFKTVFNSDRLVYVVSIFIERSIVNGITSFLLNIKDKKNEVTAGGGTYRAAYKWDVIV